ncbi:hypothetical protein B0I21_108134 [Sphingobacterium paludis]|uniref:Uncharacterized protein n=1 Tax=Sphingobacterium paludis TaxID=1476465 RepID=A0A4V6PZW7_9SPHI|nr:hypothetical protein B0I21_108134 [Sphingobacterium paludis]
MPRQGKYFCKVVCFPKRSSSPHPFRRMPRQGKYFCKVVYFLKRSSSPPPFRRMPRQGKYFCKVVCFLKRMSSPHPFRRMPRQGKYFCRAKVIKTPSLETFAGRVCAVANDYILQSFRCDISFNNDPCNYLIYQSFSIY